MERSYSARKQEYFERLTGLFSNYKKCLMVTADNVGSFQMQQVRMALRGEAVVCFGKNTMMRRVLKNFLEQKKMISPFFVGLALPSSTVYAKRFVSPQLAFCYVATPFLI